MKASDGFHLDQRLRGGGGTVEEIGLGPDGVDVLAVRRRNVLVPGLTLVPTNRVESVHPWEDTIVLARCLRDLPDHGQAFAAYQRIRQPRAEKVVAYGRRISNRKLARNPIAVTARDALLPMFLLRLGVLAALHQGAPQQRVHVGLEVEQTEGLRSGMNRLLESSGLDMYPRHLCMRRGILRINLKHRIQQCSGCFEIAQLSQRPGYPLVQLGMRCTRRR